MGAVTFSIDPHLVTMIQSKGALSVFVETGTFKGDTVATVSPYFDKIISIELSETLWAESAKRFATNPTIDIRLGSSPDKLRELHSDLQNVAAFYWLDAHWCVAIDTAGALSQCPLLEELKAIGTLNSNSILLIDDARLFLAPPPLPHESSQWPSFQQIITSLFLMSSQHEVMIINDVIVFYPRAMKTVLEDYAQHFGCDWLLASNTLKAYDDPNTLNILHRLQCIDANQQRFETNQQRFETNQQRFETNQQRFDENQQKLIKKSRGAFSRLRHRINKYTRPKLGNLHQHSPRPMTAAEKSYSKIKRSIPIDCSPTISIVTPSFSQGVFIERTILSVIEQNYPNLEYFVQDGGSIDATIDILKKYESNLTGWQSEKDSGQSQALNRGFSKTTGEIMAWLNSDDVLLPGTLNTIVHYFNRHPEVDVVYGNRLLLDENDMKIGRWILPGHDSNVLSWADYVPQETLFWRRRIWDKVGGRIDETFHFAMDWDLLIRFRDAGAQFKHISCFLAAFRVYPQQKTSSVIHNVGCQEMNRIRERLLGRVPHPKEIDNATRLFLRKHVTADFRYHIKAKFR